ncbi:MAG: SGNH/GDSL hydrolase family protein [Microthrixaceae bacterium]
MVGWTRARAPRRGPWVAALAVVAVAAGVGCTTPTYVPPVEYVVDYTPTCTAADPADCVDMLVLGDSLAYNPGRAARTRWQDLIATDLAGGDRDGWAGRFFDGATTGQGAVTLWDYARPGFSAAMWANHPEFQPSAQAIGPLDLLVLALGVNDEGQHVTPERYGEALGELVELYPADRCVIVGHWEWAIAGQPTSHVEFVYFAPEYRVQAEAVAAARGCVYVDMTDMVPNGVAVTPQSFDGLHLSDRGHAELAQLILDGLTA